ncbi:MAG: hypothetical protein VX998_07090, partial [Candidatus Thermoplasmatota archaeon]|nr:hypothetical protein [Candidatus Thermoplasmatota archaeon]
MASGRYANTKKSLLLVTLMILMTQVGYLENLNPWTNGGETLDDAEPVVAHSPSTSVMYGNNTIWATGSDAPIRGSEYIALGTDAILFQGTLAHTTRVGCPMAYNASNHTTWRPITVSSSGCPGMIGRYVGMVDGLTYFTFHPTFSNSQALNDQRGDLHAYNPANDTIYLVSSHNNLVKTAVIVGRTIYIATTTTISGHGGSSSFFAYNVDNQTTWALPAPTGIPASQLMIVGTKIFNFQMLLGAPVNIGQVFSTENGTWYTVPSLPTKGIFGDPAGGLVSNGQLLFIGSDPATYYHGSGATGGNGSEYWIYDSNNDTAWALGEFCTSVVYMNVCDGALRFNGEFSSPFIRDGTEMYFIARSHMTSSSNADMYDLWGYSTTNSTHWHMTNLSTTFDSVGTSPYNSYRFTYIRLAMLD